MKTKIRIGGVSAAILALGIVLSLGGGAAARPCFAAAQDKAAPRQGGRAGAAPAARDPGTLFAQGQAALKDGDLEGAEVAFRRVLMVDPRSGAAYSNLGVIAMRREEWDKAMTLLKKAETLDPKMGGIRLNIGLVEFRRGNYAAAIAPLASFLREQPNSEQARYLLGMCQVFTNHFAEAANVLEPLWPARSDDVLYLYLYDVAAVESGQKELDEKILRRMIEVGGDTAEYHLILGKAFLNRYEMAEAKTELELTAAMNPSLPFLHMNLGITYMRLGDYARAEAEFRKDIELEPDLADDYEQLGVLYSRMQKDEEAEKAFQEALKRNHKDDGAFLGLAKLYQKQKKFPEGLKMADAALRLRPEIHGGHYLRGRILSKLGREKEAQVEFAAAQKTIDTRLNKERDALEEGPIPNPELTKQPQ